MATAFAALHAGLLVRKGEAGPSIHAPRAPSPSIAPPPPLSDPVMRHPRLLVPPIPIEPAALPSEAVRKILTLTPTQARRLRTGAALLGRSERSLLLEAVEGLLATLAEGPLRRCACLSRAEGCLGGCGSA